MATGYRMINTTVSGSALLSGLDGDDVRALEFEAANKQLPALEVDDAEIEIEATHWVQASIGSLLLDVDFTANTNAPSLSLGPDSATGAALYFQLFNMRKKEILDFCVSACLLVPVLVYSILKILVGRARMFWFRMITQPTLTRELFSTLLWLTLVWQVTFLDLSVLSSLGLWILPLEMK